MMAFLKRLWTDESGASAVEYGLIAASIAVALIVVVSTFGDHAPSAYSSIKITQSQ